MKLADITKKRRKHLKSCHENKDNSHELIARLYSEPSHFLYELLQNADDACASEVQFKLTSQSLIFIHNGKKLFNINDVDSITTIGSSTKKDDVNSIGTFGAGFKSVFAITKTPMIHSGEYHFKIIDLIVPEIIVPLKSHKKNETLIEIPFNHPDIPKNTAYTQIFEHLMCLESKSLFFLRNISKIQWCTESDNGHYLSNKKNENNRAFLQSFINGQEQHFLEYLLFTKNIEISDTNAPLHIAIAYQLNNNKIVPVSNAKLFVFFPTTVETGLQFLVHAPYKTTPNRESIPFMDHQNQAITKEIAILIAENIQSIKEKGLLDVDFLNLLPIDSTKTHSLYKSVFKHVQKELSTKQLLPTSNNGYANASNTLLAREKVLVSLLKERDFSQLFQQERKFWLSTEITVNKRKQLRNYLLKMGIPEINMETFCKKITKEFIEKKTDEWIIQFYSYVTEKKALYRVKSYYETAGVLRYLPIIRIEDNTHVCPEDGFGNMLVYLPKKGESRFPIVKQTIATNEKAHEFLKSLGLKEPNDIDEINKFIIPKYQGDINTKEYIKDFKRVLTIWLLSNKYDKDKILDLLKPLYFIRCINQKNSIRYANSAANVYFETERLHDWFHGNQDSNIRFIDKELTNVDNSRNFLSRLGVRNDIKILGTNNKEVHDYGKHERSVNGFNPDFDIYGLEYVLSNITYKNSKFLWSLLLRYSNKLKGYIETTSNQNYSYQKGEEEISKVMVALNQNCFWLYRNENERIDLPIEQILFDELSDDYQKEHENLEKLIQVLGFKKEIVKEFEEKTGMKVISLEVYNKFIRDKQAECEQSQKIDNTKHNEDESWIPEIKPDHAKITVEDCSESGYLQEDLSNQSVHKNIENNNSNQVIKYENNAGNTSKFIDTKAIGDWGENYAKRYLSEKYPTNETEVVWLNQTGTVGKGYDFVIKQNNIDIAYYEVKSKTDETPQIFQISGTQWGWANQLYDLKNGDMYIILLISNAGKEDAKYREIINPVKLWKEGKLQADVVNIKL